jgi:hypothetical protein
MLTDSFVYDMWSLFVGLADPQDTGTSEGGIDREPRDQAKWVFELMSEEKVWALPRSMEKLGRCYFGREFWDTYRLTPLKARV